MTKQTKGELQAADVASLLRSRSPLLWVVTREEARVEGYLFEAAAAAGYTVRTWDVGQGVCDMDGKPSEDSNRRKIVEGNDPGDVLNAIKTRAEKGDTSGKGERCTWILRDLPPWLAGPQGIATLRQVRNLARLLPGVERDRSQAVILLSPSSEVPAELAGHATVIDFPLPDRDEIANILDVTIESLPDEVEENGEMVPFRSVIETALKNGTRAAAIDAAVGLTEEEAKSCYARSLVQSRGIDPVMVAKEKKRVIAREKVLEWFDPLPGGLDAVGGLDEFKAWLMTRAIAFTPAAKEFGVPDPKGAVLVGVQGCGKSMLAKAAATALKVPLLRMDMGALKSKFVGDSEANIRKAFKVIETIGPCVLWIDEIEKSLAGSTDGSSDGGVSADALGAILNWMQERTGQCFVIATANDITKLPPELLRKGRFDEIFFVDIPNASERQAIVTATLRAYNRTKAKIDLGAVADRTEGFIGAEVAQLVPEALFAAFADGCREITTDDMLLAAKKTVPLTKTAKPKIDALRAWAKDNARPATSDEIAEPTTTKPKARTRALDIG